MTLQECYAALDGDFAGVSGRLPSEKFIQKYVLKFLDDGSYELLLRSMEEENWEEAFRAAHTVKGMCQNLSFTVLEKSSSALTEALRNGKSPEAEELYPKTMEDYDRALAAIREYKAGL